MEARSMSRSSTITESWGMSVNLSSESIAPVHPGELLLEEFLKPMGVSQYRLAKAIRVPPRRINEIVHGERAVTADTALRLSHSATSPSLS
jgi:addiction module HigA family antidote